jgi:pimeloyl-ACP methyl ester carboxylesterase
VIGLQSVLPLLLALLGIAAILITGFAVYVIIKYSPLVSRHFQTAPPFKPLRLSGLLEGETVEFQTDDGLRLRGSYLGGRTDLQAGVIVYCHEYLSDRWSYHPYLDHLRNLGFDLFTFDFRNHGESDSEPGYEPMQWTSDREVRDLRAALRMLRSRPDHDPAGFGLFGVSRGGTTALLAGSREPDVWGVVTDGAFPTHGTMVPYIKRWAEIYLPNPVLRGLLPGWIYNAIAAIARRSTERRLHCRFPSAEAAAARLAPRPWLLIHGERDSYIGPEIARRLFSRSKSDKELWLVPRARHNGCREADPEGYTARTLSFLERFAPRRPWLAQPAISAPEALPVSLAEEFAAADLASEVASPVAG